MIYLFRTKNLIQNTTKNPNLQYFCDKEQIYDIKQLKFMYLCETFLCDFDPKALLEYEILIFTSQNAIFSLFLTLKDEVLHQKITHKQIVCVGESTAKIAKKVGFQNILIPTKAYGKNLFSELDFKNKKTLFLRAKEIASLPKNVDEIIVYENKMPEKNPLKNYIFTKNDILIFTSPKSVFAFYEFCGGKKMQKNAKNILKIAIGTSTKKALKNVFKSYKNTAVSPNTTIDSTISLAFKIFLRPLRKTQGYKNKKGKI